MSKYVNQSRSLTVLAQDWVSSLLSLSNVSKQKSQGQPEDSGQQPSGDRKMKQSPQDSFQENE